MQSALISEAVRWAHQVAPGAVHVAHDPPDAGRELRLLAGADSSLFPQNGDGITGRIADAAARVFSRSSGPLLVVWPDLPLFRPAHAYGALEDLRSGCDLVLGPVLDGGLYLIGFSKPLPSLFTLPEQIWRSPDVMAMSCRCGARGGTGDRSAAHRTGASPPGGRPRRARRSDAAGGHPAPPASRPQHSVETRTRIAGGPQSGSGVLRRPGKPLQTNVQPVRHPRVETAIRPTLNYRLRVERPPHAASLSVVGVSITRPGTRPGSQQQAQK